MLGILPLKGTINGFTLLETGADSCRAQGCLFCIQEYKYISKNHTGKALALRDLQGHIATL